MKRVKEDEKKRTRENLLLFNLFSISIYKYIYQCTALLEIHVNFINKYRISHGEISFRGN